MMANLPEVFKTGVVTQSIVSFSRGKPTEVANATTAGQSGVSLIWRMAQNPMTLDNAFFVLFPYFLDRQADGSWVVLNRNHKPLGLNTGSFVEYDEYPVAINLPLDQVTLKALSCSDDAVGDRVYLYRDECAPNNSAADMAAYLAKLQLLMRL